MILEEVFATLLRMILVLLLDFLLALLVLLVLSGEVDGDGGEEAENTVII